MKFLNQVCPLCDKVLKLRKVAGVTVYHCDTIAEGVHGNKSHYEVEFDISMEIQHVTIFPFAVDTFANSSKSRVYRMVGEKEGEQKWRLMMEVPVITATQEAKMLERLNKLAIFL